MAALTWQAGPQSLTLSGDLDRETLLPLWEQRDRLLADVKKLDVSKLQRVDSAGLAMLVHLRDQVSKRGSSLDICGITDRLRTLIELYNLKEIIPVDTVS